MYAPAGVGVELGRVTRQLDGGAIGGPLPDGGYAVRDAERQRWRVSVDDRMN